MSAAPSPHPPWIARDIRRLHSAMRNERLATHCTHRFVDINRAKSVETAEVFSDRDPRSATNDLEIAIFMHTSALTNTSCFWTFLTTVVLFSSVTASEESCAIPMSAITSTEPSPFGSLLKYHMERNPESGYVTLATVENSKPRARTVLFQGLADLPHGSIGICIKTHAASNKILLADSKAVEIVWWMDRTAVQFRFSGDIAYDNEKERRRVWNSLHDGAKSQFFYSPPSGASSKLDTSTRGPFFQEERVKARKDGMHGPPPSTFVVGVLVPEQVDFLDLSTLKRSNWIRKKVCEAEKPLYHWIENSGYAPPVISTTTE